MEEEKPLELRNSMEKTRKVDEGKNFRNFI